MGLIIALVLSITCGAARKMPECAMQKPDLERPVDVSEVERLVSGMMQALQAKEFNGADGLSAALTFAYRLSKAMLTMIPASEKAHNATVIGRSFQRVGMQLELEYQDSVHETVH